jgi:hypothetical protein
MMAVARILLSLSGHIRITIPKSFKHRSCAAMSLVRHRRDHGPNRSPLVPALPTEPSSPAVEAGAAASPAALVEAGRARARDARSREQTLSPITYRSRDSRSATLGRVFCDVRDRSDHTPTSPKSCSVILDSSTKAGDDLFH